MSKIQNAIGRLQEQKSRDSASGERPLAAAGPEASSLDWEDIDLGALDRKVEIDFDALAKWGAIDLNEQSSPHMREFREIKRPLVAHAFGRRATKVENGKLIMITSAMPGEGKTFVSLHLALSCAREADINVLLIDADVAKQELSALLGLSGELGLLDLLENRSLAPGQVMFDTNYPGLYLMPAGTPGSNSTELLTSSRMDEIAKVLEGKLQDTLVIFDLPPILLTSEAKAIADIAGQLVVVVGSDQTAQADVIAAVGQLDPDKAVGLVLNKVTKTDKHSAYGYGYAYRDTESIEGADTLQSPRGKPDSQKPDIWD